MFFNQGKTLRGPCFSVMILIRFGQLCPTFLPFLQSRKNCLKKVYICYNLNAWNFDNTEERSTPCISVTILIGFGQLSPTFLFFLQRGENCFKKVYICRNLSAWNFDDKEEKVHKWIEKNLIKIGHKPVTFGNLKSSKVQLVFLVQ